MARLLGLKGITTVKVPIDLGRTVKRSSETGYSTEPFGADAKLRFAAAKSRVPQSTDSRGQATAEAALQVMALSI